MMPIMLLGLELSSLYPRVPHSRSLEAFLNQRTADLLVVFSFNRPQISTNLCNFLQISTRFCNFLILQTNRFDENLLKRLYKLAGFYKSLQISAIFYKSLQGLSPLPFERLLFYSTAAIFSSLYSQSLVT